ncbi:MAG: ABC transporter ATP-binding protein [Verrucomicrobia bacterium 61-8]|nr:ABC-F family ATP-binding cassette domain-containing protein [Verrucomicrobiota bacterium]OJV26186.1 MAG: ABC transporter ATP-binding protein [Verrucomicrobia bacterium 61-8]
MLTVSQVSKSYGGRTLFSDASLQINRGDRIGLIGANGAGKSTLFSLILGENEPDDGSVTFQRGVSVGYLPQESAPSGDETILHLALSGVPEWDSYALEPKAKRILSGLAFRETDFERVARTMSGGWIMRAHLAKLLVMEPDLLLLDEPTNHLDLESLGWFQNYLAAYAGSIVTISHDRAFLNAICDTIVEISRQRLHRYTGTYDEFVEQKKAREEQYLAAYKNQQREIEHLQDFINRFRAKASKAAQAQERIKRLDKMERLAPPEQAEATVKFRFPQPQRSGQKVMELTNVRQAYGSHVVYEDLNLTVERDQRTVLVGPNGAGKSTLLKILAGMLPLEAGERTPGHNVSTGYFAQQRVETLDLKRTVLQEATSLPRYVSDEAARSVLGSFLFRGDDVFKTVGVLSGGEKSRLALVKLLLDPPNFLLLDEPTTHLDMPSIDALVNALRQYQGTLVFVSHDVHFIRALATSVLHVHAGRLTPYAGNYEYYLEKSQAVGEREALVAKLHNHQPTFEKAVEASAAPVSAPTPGLGLKEIREQRRAESEANKAAAKARRQQEALIAKLEAEVVALEKQQKELTAQLEDPALYDQPSKALEINRKLAGITDALEAANEAWMAAAEQLAEA